MARLNHVELSIKCKILIRSNCPWKYWLLVQVFHPACINYCVQMLIWERYFLSNSISFGQILPFWTRRGHLVSTTRKRSLRRLCFYTFLSVILFTGGGGGISACIAGGIPACLAAGLLEGGIPACLAGFQTHTQGGSWGSGWGGSRPTPKGEVEKSDLRGLQAHTWGGVSRLTSRGSPGPHPGGCIPACTEADPPDGYCCGRYASYWNTFLYKYMSHFAYACKLNDKMGFPA